mmetsp:Transcript_26974/g.88198  ORF Transcript_26974/g.88198 Transcript_26974/m.88198 type:complete len:133 (+) Transcript_26974:2703-3101(+)
MKPLKTREERTWRPSRPWGREEELQNQRQTMRRISTHNQRRRRRWKVCVGMTWNVRSESRKEDRNDLVKLSCSARLHEIVNSDLSVLDHRRSHLLLLLPSVNTGLALPLEHPCFIAHSSGFQKDLQPGGETG